MCSRAMTATMGKQEIKGRVRNAYWIFDAVRRSRFRCLCVYVTGNVEILRNYDNS